MLIYESTGRVGASAARSIVEEAASIDRAWWRGGLGFEGEEEEGRPRILRGETPLFHAGGVTEADDLFMAFADVLFILHRLQEWARNHTIKWRIRMNDEDWGAVDSSGFTKPLLEGMDTWASRVGAARAGPKDWRVSEARRSEILSRRR